MSQEWTKDIFFTETTVNAFDSYSTFVGDNVNSQFTVVHNLCSQDVVVTVREVGSNLITYPAIEVTSLSSVTVGFNFIPGLSAYDVTVFASASAKKITGFEDRITVNVTQPVQDISVDVTTPQTNIVVGSEQDVTTVITNTEITTTDVNVGVVDSTEDISVTVLGNNGIWGLITGTLSAQTDLWTYLQSITAGGGSDSQTLSYNTATALLSISNGNSVSLSSLSSVGFSVPQLTAYLASNCLTLSCVDVRGQILSAGTDLFDIFLTAETDAQTLTYTPSSYLLSISNGNTVNLSSINTTFANNSGKYEEVYTNVQTNSGTYATTSYVNGNFLSLSGGLVQGPVQINNNLTVFGNLTASGTTTFANTVFTTTSSLSVVHLGSGPALYVGNFGNDHIATFVDLQNGLEMMHIGGLSSSFPNVGIKTGQPNKDFTVQGEISATGTIWNGEGNSIQWNEAYNIGTVFVANSGKYEDVYTTVQTNSGSWNKNYIYVSTNTNLSSNFKYAIDTTSGTLTATLPPFPQTGDEIEIFDILGTWGVNNLVVNNNTHYIEQQKDNLLCNVRFGLIKLIYTNNNVGWRIVPQPLHDVPSITLPNISIALNTLSSYIPLTVNLTGINNLDASIAPVESWLWDLSGNSSIDSTSRITSVTYNTPGVYTIALTGSNSVGIDTDSITVTAINILPPSVSISVSSTSGIGSLSGIIPFTVNLSGTNNLNPIASPISAWYWDLSGDSNIDNSNQTTTFTYTTSGTYTINLTGENSVGVGTSSLTITAFAQTDPWLDVLNSTYSSNIAAAYDFRDYDGTDVISKIGPNLKTSNVTVTADGLAFTKGNTSWAFADSTVACSYPFTMVYVAKTNNTISSPANENVLINCSTNRFGFDMLVFTRTAQSLMPYNGQDNQTTGYLPNGSEWYFYAASFLNNGTVRYATRKISGNLNGTVLGNNGTTFNGYPGVAAGFANESVYGTTGTYRLALFINQAFSTESEMNDLFDTIVSGPAADLPLQ
jgi:hypothetical protein